MSFDPYAPYGTPIETTCRVATWNVWGRYGDWAARLDGISAELRQCAPDVVCIAETWETADQDAASLLGEALGLPHCVTWADWAPEPGWKSGVAICSRWPVVTRQHRPLPGNGEALGTVAHAQVDGPRGMIEVFVVLLDYPLHASGVRQQQVRELAEFVGQTAPRRHLVIVCGDFNAGPDSDEIRMLTGRSEPPVPGLVFYDAWEVAGDGSPGLTWSNRNPLAATALFPDRRFDYVLSAWPRRGGAGHPVRCERLGVRDPDAMQLSDHYGVVADLRY
jgi:endonuclease/exonuclease/phosphatase family metal-dependent hydrolase